MWKVLLLFIVFPFILLCDEFKKNTKTHTQLEQVFSLDFKQHYGFIIIHSRDIRSIQNSYPIGAELNFSWQKFDQNSWELCHCSPKSGVLISFFDFDNRTILGYGFNIAGFIEPVFSLGKKINISCKGVVGISFDTNPYKELTNPENLSYSRFVNGYLQFGVALYYKLSPKINLTLSGNYNHISNGGVKQPNKGINYPTLALGFKYVLKPILIKDFKSSGFQYDSKKRFDISYSFSKKKQLNNSNYFTVLGLSTTYSKQIGRIHAFTADLEWFWDYSLQLDKLDNNQKGISRGAILIGHEFLLGRFTFSQKIGPYLYNRFKNYDFFYQKYGINYYVNDKVFIGIHVKAHRHVADFIELRIGMFF